MSTLSEYTLKTAPVGTDELELQETGGGTSRKTTIAALAANLPAITATEANITGTLAAGNTAITGTLAAGNTAITGTLGVSSTITAGGAITAGLISTAAIVGNSINIAGDVSMDIRNVSSTGFGTYIAGGATTQYALKVTDYLDNLLFQVLGSGAANFTGTLEVSGATSTAGLTSTAAIVGNSINIAGDVSMDIRNTSSTGFGTYIAGGATTQYALKVTDYLNNLLFQVLGSGAANFTGTLDVSGATSTAGLTSTAAIVGNSINIAGNTSMDIRNVSSTGFGTNIAGGATTQYALKVTDYLNNLLFQVLGSGAANFTGTLDVSGALSKGSGSFRIDHPLPELTETHQLVHSFTESPQADLLYSGTTELVNGSAKINLDEYHGMTEGTFVVLNRNIRVFTTNETDWEPIKGYVTGNTLHISCQDATCTDSVSWLVIGERQDQHMYDTGWTDDEGRVIVEPLKPGPVPVPEPVQRTVQVPIMAGDKQATKLETVAVPERIEFIDGVATLIPATTEEKLVPQFDTVGVYDTDGNPVYA